MAILGSRSLDAGSQGSDLVPLDQVDGLGCVLYLDISLVRNASTQWVGNEKALEAVIPSVSSI